MKDKNQLQQEAWEKYTLRIDDTNTTQMDIFKGVYGKNSKNFMTPYVIGYGVISPKGAIVYEVSQGEGLNYETIYGVTVCKPGARLYDDSGCFQSFDDAMKHIQGLIKKYDK